MVYLSAFFLLLPDSCIIPEKWNRFHRGSPGCHFAFIFSDSNRNFGVGSFQPFLRFLFGGNGLFKQNQFLENHSAFHVFSGRAMLCRMVFLVSEIWG